MSESETTINPDQLTCPLPRSQYEYVVLGHGSGGKLSSELIERLLVPAFGDQTLGRLEDQATLAIPGQDDGQSQSESESETTTNAAKSRLAFTTDSFVVQPRFFPGGDIGTLAVHGTVNDLAVGGATPLYLSVALILEEGLPMAELQRVLRSLRAAADQAGVKLVTGDTKVVDRGKGDGLYINTSGIGLTPPGVDLSIHHAQPGDRIIVSGTVGDHGIAIMSLREGIEFETPLQSDSAALNGLTRTMLDRCPSIRCMRDPTRGGLSSTFNELAEASNVGVKLDQAAIPMRDEVKGACEMLGLDPLYVANEGKLVAIVPEADAQTLLETMRAHPLGQNAAIIGQVTDAHPGMVILHSLIGGERVVTMLAGEQLPRIC